MGLTLDQLVFDPTGPTEGANVGAFLRDNLGNLLTSTLISAHQALDVNVVSAIATSPEPDTIPASQNITAQDVGSSSTSGANGQPIVTGSPTAGSTASFTFSTQSSVRVQVSGTWTGTLTSEISLDAGTTWYPVNIAQNTASTTSSFTANFEGVTGVTATTQFRVRATAAWTGTATVQIVESVNNTFTYIGNSVSVLQGTSPWNDNLTEVGGSAISLGQKTSANSFPVVIASDQSAIPVSQSGTWTVSATQGTSPWVVSGTVTANQGTSPWVENVSQFGGNPVVTGTGASGLGIPRVTVSNDSNILATQSGTWTVQQGTPPWSVVGNVADNAADSGDPVKTGTRSSFGAALSAITTTNDRADMISDRYRRLFVSGSADVAVKNTAVTATTAAASLLGSQLQGRRKIYIQNNSSKSSIYLGHDNTVTSSNGLKVAAGAVFEDEIGEDVAVWVIGDAASVDVRVYELA